MHTPSHSIIVIGEDDERGSDGRIEESKNVKNETTNYKNVDESGDGRGAKLEHKNDGNNQLEVIDDPSQTLQIRKVSLLDLSSDEPSSSKTSTISSLTIPLKWKAAAVASVEKEGRKQVAFVSLKDRLATRLCPSNPLLASLSTPPTQPPTLNSKAKERWALVRSSVVKNPSKPRSIIDVIRLAKSYEAIKAGIRRKESHSQYQQQNLSDKKEKRKIGALMLGCLIEADLPGEFLKTLCKSQQLQRMIKSFTCGSSQSKQLLTDLCLEDFD